MGRTGCVLIYCAEWWDGVWGGWDCWEFERAIVYFGGIRPNNTRKDRCD